MAALGLLSPEFPAVSLDANLDAIAATGATSVQFDLVSALGHSFPAELPEHMELQVRSVEFKSKRLRPAPGRILSAVCADRVNLLPSEPRP